MPVQVQNCGLCYVRWAIVGSMVNDQMAIRQQAPAPRSVERVSVTQAGRSNYVRGTKLFAIALALVATVFALSACGTSGSTDNNMMNRGQGTMGG